MSFGDGRSLVGLLGACGHERVAEHHASQDNATTVLPICGGLAEIRCEMYAGSV